jgi:hypothetical protein
MTGTEEKSPHQLGIDLKSVCRSLLKIVARFEETQYTEVTLRQTAERELDDLADPASGTAHRRAETHCTPTRLVPAWILSIVWDEAFVLIYMCTRARKFNMSNRLKRQPAERKAPYQSIMSQEKV